MLFQITHYRPCTVYWYRTIAKTHLLSESVVIQEAFRSTCIEVQQQWLRANCTSLAVRTAVSMLNLFHWWTWWPWWRCKTLMIFWDWLEGTFFRSLHDLWWLGYFEEKTSTSRVPHFFRIRMMHEWWAPQNVDDLRICGTMWARCIWILKNSNLFWISKIFQERKKHPGPVRSVSRVLLFS